MLLEIKDLHVCIKSTDKPILKGVNLSIKKGEQHVLIGKNGSGKSTLGYTIMGHSDYKITKGKILFEGKDISNLDTDKRAKLGLFLSFQNPLEIEGVSGLNFLRIAKNSIDEKKETNVKGIVTVINKYSDDLEISNDFLSRNLNLGFSGGEKKKNEILQLKTLKPKLAILDEVDSGLDAGAVNIVGKNIKNMIENEGLTTLLISHYMKIPKMIGSKKFHILKCGKIIKSTGFEDVKKIMMGGFK